VNCHDQQFIRLCTTALQLRGGVRFAYGPKPVQVFELHVIVLLLEQECALPWFTAWTRYMSVWYIVSW